MESRNPIFNRSEPFRRGGHATFTPTPGSPADLERMYGLPSATPAQTGRMTLDDVVVRTATLFAMLLTTAAATFFVLHPGPIVVLGSALVGFVLAMVASFGRPKPAVMIAYSAVEGVFVGGVSWLVHPAVRQRAGPPSGTRHADRLRRHAHALQDRHRA